MEAPTPAELASMRADAALWMPSSCQNLTTGETHPCRVEDGRAQRRMQHTQSFLRFREWMIVQPFGVRITTGNNLTVTGDGSGPYVVLEDVTHATYALETRAQCALLVTGSDGWQLPVYAESTASFISALHPELGELTANVHLFHPTMDDLQSFGISLGTRWGVLFDPAMHWPNSTVKPDDGDSIRCAAALGVKDNGTAREATLSAVLREFGILPVATAFFAEEAH